MSQSFAIFAIRPQFLKICTREIFISRVYPQKIWHLEVLFAVPLYYGTLCFLHTVLSWSRTCMKIHHMIWMQHSWCQIKYLSIYLYTYACTYACVCVLHTHVKHCPCLCLVLDTVTQKIYTLVPLLYVLNCAYSNMVQGSIASNFRLAKLLLDSQYHFECPGSFMWWSFSTGTKLNWLD